MSMHPGHRLVQLGLQSLGADPGKIDGWFGAKTAGAASAVLRMDPPKGSDWAFDVLQRGLDYLGWFEGAYTADWSDDLRLALTGYLVAEGLPRAGAVAEGQVVTKSPSMGVLADHGRVIRQGSAGYEVDTLYLHTSATPGNWWRGKTNRQMFDEIKRWHTDPKSKGGRGWRAPGYHGVLFPDGEEIVGRGETDMGAGVRGHNRGSLHYCMIPTKTITRMALPETYYTPATIDAMRRKIADVGGRTNLRRLRGHNEDAAKLCPGFIVVDHDWTDLPVT